MFNKITIALATFVGILGSLASAGTVEDMNRQRLFFCSQSLIEEQGTMVPQWVSDTVGVARNAGDCIKIPG